MIAVLDHALCGADGGLFAGAVLASRAAPVGQAEDLPGVAQLDKRPERVVDRDAGGALERDRACLAGGERRVELGQRVEHPMGAAGVSFALRLRRLLGVGVRAEVIRALLTIRATRVSGKVITASAAFAQRNVREGLTRLLEAGVVNVVDIAHDRYYSVRHGDWATLFGLPAAPDLPFHSDWIPAYRALTRIVRWLEQPGLDDLSDYLRASQARTLVDELATDLSY